MPKKMKGENSKAVEAKARKAEAKAAEASQKEKETEDAYWKDDDKQANRKIQRKAGKEQKRQEELAKKEELRKMLEEEESNIKIKVPSSKKGGSGKLTRAQVEANEERMEKEREEAAAAAQKQATHLDAPLEENLNIRLAQEEQDGVVSARDVGEAISALSIKEADLVKHPEKRVKAAYAAYEEVNLPILKAQNPSLRLSQLKQMLKKDWMKSPENPMNQQFQDYNAKK